MTTSSKESSEAIQEYMYKMNPCSPAQPVLVISSEDREFIKKHHYESQQIGDIHYFDERKQIKDLEN